mmetsp:Transcript_8037/g.35746  ORF Transcript_8037/g.35746 Transcript_8037/m.35746 type:complete len:120 (+) Transcript_8037:1986-2345(+)
MRINELRSQVDRVQSMGAGMGPLGGFREVMLKKLEKETLEEARRKLCYDVYLIENDQDDPDLISFAAASSSYLLRLLCFGKPPELPLSVRKWMILTWSRYPLRNSAQATLVLGYRYLRA